MTSIQGTAERNSAANPTPQDTPNLDLEEGLEGEEELDEFGASSLAEQEPDTLEFDDDADADVAFSAETDPDVAAVDSAMSASRKQQKADKNSNIRRMLEERSEARQLQQDLDYLDFDD